MDESLKDMLRTQLAYDIGGTVYVGDLECIHKALEVLGEASRQHSCDPGRTSKSYRICWGIRTYLLPPDTLLQPTTPQPEQP